MTLPTNKQLEAMLANASEGDWHFYYPPSWHDGLGYIRTDADDAEIAHHGDARRRPLENIANGNLLAASKSLAAQRIADASRIEALEGFIRDFAATPFNTLQRPFIADLQDRPDDATDLAAVLAWQDDALDLMKGAKP